MDWVAFIKNTILIIGVPTIAVALVKIGRKLQILDGLKNTVETIKHNLKVVSDFLTINSALNPSELKNYSPLTLTDDGIKFIKDLGFDKVFNNNKKDFFDFIDEQNPKVKYDVELSAIKSIYFLADKSYMNFLKIHFYNNPTRSMNNTAPTLGVYVREKYLEEHSEITE